VRVIDLHHQFEIELLGVLGHGAIALGKDLDALLGGHARLPRVDDHTPLDALGHGGIDGPHGLLLGLSTGLLVQGEHVGPNVRGSHGDATGRAGIDILHLCIHRLESILDAPAGDFLKGHASHVPDGHESQFHLVTPPTLIVLAQAASATRPARPAPSLMLPNRN